MEKTNSSVQELILKEIENNDIIVIYGHVRPDGDCYGSQFGLKDIIKETYPQKEVYVVGHTSEYVSFVGIPDSISEDVCRKALSIVVDTGSAERISDQRYIVGKKIIKIDHHIAVSPYGDIQYVNEAFPACSQMIAAFYHLFSDKLKISKKGATALYTGIITDTGNFKFRGVSRQTHQLAGLLLDLGADVEEINILLSKTTLNLMRLKGEVFDNIKTSKYFIYAELPRFLIKKHDVSFEDAASMVNSLGGADGYPVWALIIEYDNKEIRVRLRSNGPDIDKIANCFNGGGHAKAAGLTLKSWRDVKKLAKMVDETVAKYLTDNE